MVQAPGYPESRSTKFPLSAIDRTIDDLGAEHAIGSEESAKTYIDALLAKFRIDDEQVRDLTKFRSRLAHAEYNAVRNRKKRIPEVVVTQAFNRLMDAWSAPIQTRISTDELHAFRILTSVALTPKSTSRSSHGSVSPVCRPVEALYLIYLLQSQGGVEPELREAVKSGRTADNLFGQSQTPVSAGLRLSPAQGRGAYFRARANYFAQHPSLDIPTEIDRLLNQLGIE